VRIHTYIHTRYICTPQLERSSMFRPMNDDDVYVSISGLPHVRIIMLMLTLMLRMLMLMLRSVKRFPLALTIG